jgi:AraC-like DNA-binding protein
MAFGGRVIERLPHWARRIRKLAVILPDGLPGLLVAGLLPSLQPPFPFRFTHAAADASAFLERPELAAVIDEVERAVVAARGRSVLLDRLRAHLERALQHPSLGAAAAALGLSTRSLQRELRNLETSFSNEVRRTRVGAATELMRSTDGKIDAIAPGVKSSPHVVAATGAQRRDRWPSELYDDLAGGRPKLLARRE